MAKGTWAAAAILAVTLRLSTTAGTLTLQSISGGYHHFLRHIAAGARSSSRSAPSHRSQPRRG